jgi:6-phospho-beta-glucosidase
VLNLTNPLSVTTALIAKGGARVWGLCELPTVTHRTAARLLGHDPARLSWAYTGLNHRGFLHHLEIDGSLDGDPLEALAESLVERSTLGVLGDEVQELDALPLKYFGLLAGHAPHGAGRAARLVDIRASALRELRGNPRARPASLTARPTPWYSECVGPVIGALADGGPLDTVLNLPGADGLVREQRVTIEGGRCVPLPDVAPPASARPWLDRFEGHERAVLQALDLPTQAALRAACVADPLLPEARVEDAVRLLSR